MMNDCIAVIAIFIFFVSSYLVYDLFSNGFNIFVLLGALIGYLIVHFIWPKNRNSESVWYDSLEFIFDLPYRTIALFLRGLFSWGRKGDIDVDL
jgi:intein/homing endonuclease